MGDPDTRDEADETFRGDLVEFGEDATSVSSESHQYLHAETHTSLETLLGKRQSRVKINSYIAQYPFVWHPCLIEYHFNFFGKHSSVLLKLLCEDNLYTNISYCL